MSYKSIAFEKQLAKYRQDQAVKSIMDLPDHKHRPAERVQASPQAQTSRGLGAGPSLRTHSLDEIARASAPQHETPVQTDQVLAAHPAPERDALPKKPLYARTWFWALVMLVMVGIAAKPMLSERLAQLHGIAQTIENSTGIDPFSAKTYGDLARGKLDAPKLNAAAADTKTQPLVPVPAPSHDTAQMMREAQDRADAVARQGSSASMRYIEEETKRLNEMAKEIDQRQGRAGQTGTNR
ncbi:MAG: hypothetical protein H6865_08065 [Rhodospirillales bacterium]|nr:hypothetical protein [Alphaproteobacteria bacterium]MCB9987571.1 hypothetical protein [Rhodospirillales bacterium]USO07709.1 MAG: hypothetical protein H6866_00285 [Rhodospirillales bacterium]